MILCINQNKFGTKLEFMFKLVRVFWEFYSTVYSDLTNNGGLGREECENGKICVLNYVVWDFHKLFEIWKLDHMKLTSFLP